MKNISVYIKLAEKYGYRSRRKILPKILQFLIAPDEAELLLQLPNSAVEISKLTDRPPVYVKNVLKKAFRKGLVTKCGNKGSEMYYLVKEYNESMISDKKSFFINKKYVDLWRKWEDETVKQAVDAGGAGYIARVLPVENVIASPSKIKPFEKLSAIVNSARSCAIVLCPCRAKQNICKDNYENCLMFDGSAEFYINRGVAKSASKKKVLEILKRSEDAGLVHTTTINLFKKGKVQVVCNCCSCCCHIFKCCRESDDMMKMMPSNYYPVWNEDKCSECGICVNRCHFNAVSLKKEGISFNHELCTGCGLCASGCESKAINLYQCERLFKPETIDKDFISPITE